MRPWSGLWVRGTRSTRRQFCPQTAIGRTFPRAANILAMGAVENARIAPSFGHRKPDRIRRTVLLRSPRTDGRNRVAGCRQPILLHHARHGVGHLRYFPICRFPKTRCGSIASRTSGSCLTSAGGRAWEQHGRAVKSQLDRWRPRGTRELRILVRMENTPNPESRITLADDTDAYGVPRVVLDWRVNPFDLEYLERLCGVLGQEIGRAGGRVRIDYSLARARARRAATRRTIWVRRE